MKSIVFLSHLHDEHERGGAYLRNFALLSALDSWGFKTRAFYRGEFKLHSQKIKKYFMGLRFGREIRSLFTKATFDVPKCEILILDTFKYFSWNLRFHGGRPLIIYNAHNLEFENHFGKESSPQKSRFALYECERLMKMDIVLVCSEREKALLCSINEKLAGKVFVFPNLVSSERFQSRQNHQRHFISFIGTLDYFPNIEAVKFLANDLYPLLPEDLKKRFIIAGRRASAQVQQLCEEKAINLQLDLSEAQMTKLFLETSVLLVPLEHGSGTRLKIIEGALAGCRILTTSIGREGIEKEGMVVSALDDFLDNLISLSNLGTEGEVGLEEEFLEKYELSSWAKKNKNTFLKCIEEKLS